MHDDERIGCSPDGLIHECGIEIKCPAPRQHIRNVLADGMDDYITQVQGNILDMQNGTAGLSFLFVHLLKISHCI